MDRQSTPTRSELKRMLCDSKAEPKALQLSLLEEITNGFSEEQEIGRGGFAVVYKGMLDNVTAVAVKRLSHTYMHEKQFQREVECLIKVKHKNVVQFLGYCADSQGIAESYNGEFVIADVQQRLLCFEYLPHGTLDKYITDASCGLEWRIRYKIINGICDGLHYLHQNRIVHLDLKPPNILLDGNMLPKIADFGLSRCFKEKQSRAITTKIGGTVGYLAPEFGSREITYQFDLYSLGVIIIEILTGKKGYASVEDVLEIWSNRLEKSHRAIHLEQIRVCTEIGIDCIESNPAKRPVSMQHIISRLHETGNTEGSVETVMKKSSALQAGTDSDSQHQGAPGLTSSETSSVCELVDEVPPMAVSATSSDQVRLISASNGLGEMNIEDFSYSGTFLVIDRTISGKANIFDEAIIARERRGKQQPVPHPLSRPAAMPFPLPSTSVSGSASASASSRGRFSLGTSAASDEPPDLGICRLAIDSRKQSHVLEERHFVTNNQVLEHTRSSEASVSPRKEFQLNIFELSTDGTTNCHARKSREIVPTRMPSSPPSSRGQHCPTSHVHSRAFGQSSGWKDDSRSSSSAHPLPLPPGTPCSSSRSLHSQWKKGKLLGSGTFGQVYLGFNSEGGQMCVIKEVTVTADDSHSKEYLGQLNQEMLLLNKLSHPNIVQYYGSEMSSKTLSVYLEFVSGGSIHKLLREYGPFGEAVIRNYTAQILSGLAYLHGRKTLHRDIKGANILLDPNGVIKLADFGMAISAYTSIKSVKGSPYWMAPEVIMNTNGYSLPVDIWSLGCTILEMATARRPWSQYEGVAALFKIANGKIIPDIPDHLSSEAKSFLRLCLQRDPAARPTAVQLIEHPWVKYQASVRNSRSGITRD